MLREMCRAKIHLATVTETKLEYSGSITIDTDLLSASGILRGEKVQVLNASNGVRVETYVIEGQAGSGTICMNGPAARLFQVGDRAVIICYVLVEEEEARSWKPKLVFVDGRNRITRVE